MPTYLYKMAFSCLKLRILLIKQVIQVRSRHPNTTCLLNGLLYMLNCVIRLFKLFVSRLNGLNHLIKWVEFELTYIILYQYINMIPKSTLKH